MAQTEKMKPEWYAQIDTYNKMMKQRFIIKTILITLICVLIGIIVLSF